MQKQESIKYARGESEKFFDVTPSRTAEYAFLECETNITFIINFWFEKNQVSLLESFLDWVVQYIKLYLSYPCLFQFDLMLHHH